MIRGAKPGEVALALWRRIDVRRIFLGDVALKAVALVVALLLFVWATALYNAPPPEVTIAFEGRIPVERPAVADGYVLRAQPGDVAVRLRGPAEAVSAVGQQHLRATLDLGGLAPARAAQEAPVRVTVADERVVVVETTPATVPVRFERRTERTMQVQPRLANDPPPGFVAAPATFEPQEVTVSGPESAVGDVATVYGVVRFGDAPVDLAQDVRPLAVDARGDPVDDVEVDPVAVHVSVPVRSSATTRTVPLVWELSGDVAPGYWISRVTTDPLVVTVSGDREVVAEIDQIETEPVDVAGLTQVTTSTVDLVVPEGARVVGEPRATITITVVVLTGTRPFPLVAVQPQNVGLDLTARADPPTVTVIVTGTVPALQGTAADAVTATVDAAGLGPGTYVLDVVVHAPADLTVKTVQPLRASVTISGSASPTPSPSPS